MVVDCSGIGFSLTAGINTNYTFRVLSHHQHHQPLHHPSQGEADQPTDKDHSDFRKGVLEVVKELLFVPSPLLAFDAVRAVALRCCWCCLLVLLFVVVVCVVVFVVFCCCLLLFVCVFVCVVVCLFVLLFVVVCLCFCLIVLLFARNVVSCCLLMCCAVVVCLENNLCLRLLTVFFLFLLVFFSF